MFFERMFSYTLCQRLPTSLTEGMIFDGAQVAPLCPWLI